MLLIPAIDLKDGRCVRLHQGDFAKATAYTSTPHALLNRYEALGAGWVHIVDLEGAKDGKRANHSVVAGLSASTAVKLQVGGGIRSAAAVEVLLDVGASRVVIGSVAVHHPEEVLRWFKRFGPERLCLALDVRTSPKMTRACTRTAGPVPERSRCGTRLLHTVVWYATSCVRISIATGPSRVPTWTFTAYSSRPLP